MPASALPSSHRRGITLLEVLIAMFVLAVGILSIFALFTAGRELESRATIKSNAMAFAATQRETIGTQWLDWRQWLTIANPAIDRTFRWAKPDPGGSLQPIVLPVIVDPWGMCFDQRVREDGGVAWESAPDPDDVFWDWSRFVPLTSAIAGSSGVNEPFQRVTLPRNIRPGPIAVGDAVIDPLNRESVLLTLADKDAIEYRISADPNEPPFNAFEAGQRKRSSDLVPAVFIAAAFPAANNVVPGTLVKRSLLIFHKPVPDFEKSTSGNAGTTYWPSGVVELRVTQHENGLIRAKLAKEPDDRTVVRRSLRPGKWVLFTYRMPRTPGPPPLDYFYDTVWRELTSVTEDDNQEWLIVPKTDLPVDPEWPRTPENSLLIPALVPPRQISSWDTSYPNPDPSIDQALYSPIYCYGFEHLVHVEDLDGESTTPLE
jgi:type II secretory pathway pseudopilin PulG